MTKKDYQLIANVIHGQLQNWDGNPDGRRGLLDFARHLAIELKKENSLFQPAKFFEACGLTANGE